MFIPGWCGMTSPMYSALPQELLLEADPRRPEIKALPFSDKKTQGHLKGHLIKDKNWFPQ